MRIILLLCAVSALTISAVPVEVPAAQEIHQVPVEEVPAAQEIHQDVELPVLRKGERIFCETGWSKFGSRCFIYVSTTKTWKDAERFCQRDGAHLASVHSLEEYDFVQEVVRGTTGRFPKAWLGGKDANKDGIWAWSDGSDFNDSFWADSMPENPSSWETCVVINYSNDLLWGDEECNRRHPFVCGTEHV